MRKQTSVIRKVGMMADRTADAEEDCSDGSRADPWLDALQKCQVFVYQWDATGTAHLSLDKVVRDITESVHDEESDSRRSQWT